MSCTHPCRCRAETFVPEVSVNDEFAREVEQKSGQCKSPTLVDGKILADASVEQVAEHLESLGWKI